MLVSFGLFATDVDNTKGPATIEVISEVAPFSTFGVSLIGVTDHYFQSIEKFQRAVSSSIATDIEMIALNTGRQIAFLSGINNTNGPVEITVTISDLVSGNNVVPLKVSPTEATIPAAKDSAFGTLKNARINIQELNRGSSLVAPAGDYKATITFALTT